MDWTGIRQDLTMAIRYYGQERENKIKLRIITQVKWAELTDKSGNNRPCEMHVKYCDATYVIRE
jgi:hypothetical protein